MANLLLNKATSDCSIVNLSPFFTILGFLANNDNVDMSHDFGCQRNHFGRKLCVTIVTEIGILYRYIIKLAGTMPKQCR